MQTADYIKSQDDGKVHLADWDGDVSLCGKVKVLFRLDETASGMAADCGTCKAVFKSRVKADA